MKTTVELPADLLRQLKAAAALKGQTMKEFLIEAVREHLAMRNEPRGGWRTVFGKAPSAAVREVDARLRDLERVDRQSWE